jgi:hypothetical protein
MQLIGNYSSAGLTHSNHPITLNMEEEPTVNQTNQTPSHSEEKPVNCLPEMLETLKMKLGPDPEPLYLKLQRIFLRSYKEEEKTKIEELLAGWKEFELGDIMDC